MVSITTDKQMKIENVIE